MSDTTAEPAAKPTIDAEELAGLLGLSKPYLVRRRGALEQQGMPRPVADGMSPVWSRRNILAWIDGDLRIDHAPGRKRRAGGGR